MLSFPGAGRGLGQQSSRVLASFFFNFFPFFFSFFLKLSCGCDVFNINCWRVFSFVISKYWKKYMYVVLPPFAGCQSAFSQNHSQNVNEVLLT